MTKSKATPSPSILVGAVFLVLGIISSLFSVLYQQQVTALVGLGLLFWGVLFLLIGPAKQIESDFLSGTALSLYSTLDRIIREFEITGRAFYIPPYIKGAYLPEHLQGLKDPVVFISSRETKIALSNEEIAKGSFLSQDQKGIFIAPPGKGLLAQIERKSRIDFTGMQLKELCDVVPRLLLNNFGLTREIEMSLLENGVTMEIKGSAYRNLYNTENDFRSIQLLGCPLVSAVACAIAQGSNRIVTITKMDVSQSDLSVKVWYQFLEKPIDG